MNSKRYDSDVYDQALATQIAGGNPAIAAELLALLLKELPSQREALNQAFATSDPAKLRELNHKLHGSARYCGTPALMNSTRELAKILSTGPSASIAKAFADVIRDIDRLLALQDR